MSLLLTNTPIDSTINLTLIAKKCCCVLSLYLLHDSAVSVGLSVICLVAVQLPTVIPPPSAHSPCATAIVSGCRTPTREQSITEGRRLISNEPLTSYFTAQARIAATHTPSITSHSHDLRILPANTAAILLHDCSSPVSTAYPFSNDHAPQPLILLSWPASQRIAAAGEAQLQRPLILLRRQDERP